MQLEIITLSKKKTNTIWYHICVESKISKVWQKWAHMQNRKRLNGHREQTCGFQGGGGWGRDEVGGGG